MSASIVVVVLLAALLHATWNAVVKSSRDKSLDIALVTAGSAAVCGISVPFLPFPASAIWPYAAASIVIHVLYFTLVGLAYRAGDMSYAYPIMRGIPPLLVALASGPLIGDHLSTGAWGGIMLICTEVLGLTFVRRESPGMAARPTVFALINAVVIAAYTLVDGIGARLSGHAVAYTCWVLLLTAAPIIIWAALRRRRDLPAYLRGRWHLGLVGGACTAGAYTLVLWAMTQAPVATVAALRETAILFGMAMSALLLRERFGWTRYASAVVIAFGSSQPRWTAGQIEP